MIETTITIEREVDGHFVEMEVICRLEYTPASRGHRDKYGAPEEPDEPESLDFYDARLADGAEIELADSEEDSAIQQAFEERINL
jgi:hypothetical protein